MVIFLEVVLVICLLIKYGMSLPSPMYDRSSKYEEYIIEHEISMGQARNVVLSMDVDSIVIPPGCQKCNEKEKRYCLGADLISDHCCCDKRYHELFPFIPHTCYFGTQLCQTVAEDCTEYQRLRSCCCQKYTLEKLKLQMLADPDPTTEVVTNNIVVKREAIKLNLTQTSLRFDFAPHEKKMNVEHISQGRAKSRGVGISENSLKVSTLFLFVIFKYIFYTIVQ